jgi:hypothetical protein
LVISDGKDSEIEDNSEPNVSKPNVIITPKKRGRKKGATGYSTGDMNALLESVGFILPTIDSQWDFVANHYNESYSSKYDRPNKSAIALKSKFRDLCHGPPSGGGSRTKHELEAKKLEGMIDDKAGIIINDVDSDQYASNDEINFTEKSTKNCDTKLDNEKEKKQKPMKKKLKTRMDFEKQVMTFLTESSKLDREEAQKRHNEKMELFKMFIQNHFQQPPNNE